MVRVSSYDYDFYIIEEKTEIQRDQIAILKIIRWEAKEITWR